MKRYEHAGELLLDLRTHLSRTQVEMAEWLKVEERTYRRWEKNQNLIADANIEDITHETGIPFEVLHRLNHEYPTLYNLCTRRYSVCPFDRDFVNKKILRRELLESREIGSILPLTSYPQFKRTSYVEFPVYPYEKEFSRRLLRICADLLPELNILITDPKNYYSGHLIAVPMKMDRYRLLREGEMAEYQIQPEDVADITPDEPVAIHILSFFATASTYAYCLAKRMVYFLLAAIPHRLHEESVLSRYVVTSDGAEFCRKFGMELIRWGYEDFQNLNTEVVPHFFELPIHRIEWLDHYRKKIGKS